MMRSCVVTSLCFVNVVDSFHVSTFGRPPVFRSRIQAVTHSSGLCMAASPLPSAETVHKTAVSALAALMVVFSPVQSALAAEVATASPELSPAQMLVKKTTDVQKKRLKEEQQKELQGDVKMSEGDLIARVVVSIKAELYELGAPDISGFPGLDTEDTRLIVAAFGKDGPPVAAKRLTVQGRQFPVTVELTVDDLAFPLTKEAWKRDARSQEDIGLAVEIDPDGKAATLDSDSLTGYGVSKPLRIGAQMERTEAAIELLTNPQLKEKAQQSLPSEGVAQLERVDAMLDYKEAKAPKASKVSKASRGMGRAF